MPATRPGGSSADVPTPGGAPDTAGTVKSFEGGILVVELPDHSTVSGHVTERTELRCETSAAPGESGDDGEEGAGAGEDSHGGGADSAVRASSREDSGGGGDGEEAGEDDGPPPSCTTAALTPGTVVAEAELSVGTSGAVWDRVELIL